MRRLLTEMMGEYLNDLDGHALVPLEIPTVSRLPGSAQLPVAPKAVTWSVDRQNRCLTRSYEFRDHERMCDFLRELLDYESSTGHYGKLLCEYPAVTVSVKTHDVDDVTEIDKEYAKHCDHIYDDVIHYGSGQEEWDEAY